MSQVSKMLEGIKPGSDKAIQEATSLVLDEALKILTPVQLETLKLNISLRHPDIDKPSNGNGQSVTYQLQALLKQIISR
ncbi:TPA: hypothetical protein JD334_00455 [Citrobacter freundii]|nr:hypothetical protein [Citrobacter freundii]